MQQPQYVKHTISEIYLSMIRVSLLWLKSVSIISLCDISYFDTVFSFSYEHYGDFLNNKQSPTAAPTPSPTVSPTNSPTSPGEVRPDDTVLDPNDNVSIVGGGDEWTDWYEQCEDITAPHNNDTEVVSDGLYATDVCISAYDLSIFEYTDSDDSDTTASFGWYCDESKQQYFMGLFKDDDCTILDRNDFGSEYLIGYTDDACLPIDVALWTSVECQYYDGQSASITTTSDKDVTPDGNTAAVIYGYNGILLGFAMITLFGMN